MTQPDIALMRPKTGVLQRLWTAWRRRNHRPERQLEAIDDRQPIVVVTGGSRGIGLALAREFARRHQRLLLVARDAVALQAAAAEITTLTGQSVAVLPLDITVAGAADRISEELRLINGYCDVLVNNAAVGLSGPLVGQSPAELERLVNLNIGALTTLTRYYLGDMLKRGRGGILNVASLGGLVPGPHQAAYYASKAYVISLTEAIAAETRGQGVDISVLAPGPVATGFHRAMGAEHSYYLTVLGQIDPERVARSAVHWFGWGRVLILPGWFDHIYAVALRLLPHQVTIRLMGILLKRR